MFTPGDISGAQAAALNELWRNYLRYGFKVGVVGPGLTRHEAGKSGQIIGINPQTFAASGDSPRDYLLDACVIVSNGVTTGLALVRVDGDGSGAVCDIKSNCGCSQVGPPPEGEAYLQVQYAGDTLAPTARVEYPSGTWTAPQSIAGGGHFFGPYPESATVTLELTNPPAVAGSDVVWYETGGSLGTTTGSGHTVFPTLTGGSRFVMFYHEPVTPPVPPPPVPPPPVPPPGGGGDE